MTLRTDLPLTILPAENSRRSARLIALAVGGAIGVGVLGYSMKGTGLKDRILRGLGVAKKPAPVAIVKVPSISKTVPADCETGVDPAAPIQIALALPNAPLDERTVTDDAVGLFRVDTRQRVAAKVTVDGAGLRVTPTTPLEPNRNYRLHVLPGLADTKGGAIRQVSRAFFTSAKPPAGVAFERVEMPIAKGEGFTSLNFGPDGKLYASTHEGKLIRYVVAADGTLGSPEVFTTLIRAEGGPRLFTGFTFDPTSTPDAPVIYLTHSEFGFENVADFTGKISRLSGPKFDVLDHLVVNLPRSARDHATNQPKFGPDGALYVPQPSNTAVGAPDKYWAFRKESGLNATILRLDVRAMTPGRTIDARTVDAGGPFVWDSTASPLTVYANGLRMPYDVLWHSNGNLYTSVNGASSKGATPAGTSVDGVSVAGIADVSLAEHDWLFKVERGHYYGHPNPVHGRLVLNGGNPTAGPDFNEVSDYPVGTRPDANWTSALFDFGMHTSADGMVEYRGGHFGGALDGKIFVCRYNIGSDLLCIGLDANGNVASAVSGIPGTENLVGPLDVTQDVRTGNLYVAEYHERQPSETRITLLRAIDPSRSATTGAH